MIEDSYKWMAIEFYGLREYCFYECVPEEQHSVLSLDGRSRISP